MAYTGCPTKNGTLRYEARKYRVSFKKAMSILNILKSEIKDYRRFVDFSCDKTQ